MTTSVELLTDNALNVFDAFRTIFGQDNRTFGSDENVVLNSNANVRIAFWTINVGTPCSKIQTGFNREAHARF